MQRFLKVFLCSVTQNKTFTNGAATLLRTLEDFLSTVENLLSHTGSIRQEAGICFSSPNTDCTPAIPSIQFLFLLKRQILFLMTTKQFALSKHALFIKLSGKYSLEKLRAKYPVLYR